VANDITFANTGTGAVPNATVVKTRQTVSGGQYALSVGSSSPTTLTVPATATHAWISVDTASNTIRWTRDGTAPTATVGHELAALDSIEVDNISSFRMISKSGTATVQVSYHKYV
jgi:hypothetical protein